METKNLPVKSEIEKKHFLEIYSPLNFTMNLAKNGIKNSYTAIKGNFTSLAGIRKEFGGETLFDFVTIWLVKLNEYVFGRSDKQMTEYQISETATLIIESYYYINVAEIAIIFKKIKSGAYGKVYGELNGMFILDAFNQYSIERAKAINQINQDEEKKKRAKLYENSNDYIPMPDVVKAKILKMQKKFTNNFKIKQ